MASPSRDMNVGEVDYELRSGSRKRTSPLVDCLLPVQKYVKPTNYPTPEGLGEFVKSPMCSAITRTVECQMELLKQQKEEGDRAREKEQASNEKIRKVSEERDIAISQLREQERSAASLDEQRRQEKQAREEAENRVRDLERRLEAKSRECEAAQSQAQENGARADQNDAELHQHQQQARYVGAQVEQAVRDSEQQWKKSYAEGQSQLQALESCCNELQQQLRQQQQEREMAIQQKNDEIQNLQRNVDKMKADLKHWTDSEEELNNAQEVREILRGKVHTMKQNRVDMIKRHARKIGDLEESHGRERAGLKEEIATAHKEIVEWKEKERKREQRAAASGHGGHSILKEKPKSTQHIGKTDSKGSFVLGRSSVGKTQGKHAKKPVKRSAATSLRHSMVIADLEHIYKTPQPYMKKDHPIDALLSNFNTLVEGASKLGLQGNDDAEELHDETQDNAVPDGDLGEVEEEPGHENGSPSNVEDSGYLSMNGGDMVDGGTDPYMLQPRARAEPLDDDDDDELSEHDDDEFDLEQVSE